MFITVHNMPKNKAKLLSLLKELKPSYCRVSFMQADNWNPGLAGEIARMGLNVVPVMTSNTAGAMDEAQWAVYCCKCVANVPKGTPAIQVGNEWNTSRFWGRSPDATIAFKRFKMAVEIIRTRLGRGIAILAPGLTNESKTASNKIAAALWIKTWLALGLDNLGVYAWALHYYDTDQRLSSTFLSNVNYLRANSKTPVIITETGSAVSSNQIPWYNKMKQGLYGIPQDMIGWYCFNNHKEFALVDDTTGKVSALYTLWVKG